jgi:hypothetical protein
MHTTAANPALARPGGRRPLRVRNVAIAALGVVSAIMVAAGAAIGGGQPVPHIPAAPAASAPALPAHLHEHYAATKSGGR